MIVITLDTDWAAEEVLNDAVTLLENNRIKATIFATGPYQCLDNKNEDLFEVALHPNIDRFDALETGIKALKEFYPDAAGIRLHSLTHSSRFLPVFKKNRLRYMSTYLMPDIHHIVPVRFFNGLIEFPIFFMDDYYLYREDPTFSPRDLALEQEGLKILAFHPIHIFLNTRSPRDYEEVKNRSDDYSFLKQKRKQGPGTRSLFNRLMDYLRENQVHTHTLKDLVEKQQP